MPLLVVEPAEDRRQTQAAQMEQRGDEVDEGGVLGKAVLVQHQASGEFVERLDRGVEDEAEQSDEPEAARSQYGLQVGQLEPIVILLTC